MWRILLLALFLGMADIEADAQDALQREEQAVVLARAGHYDEALKELTELSNSGLKAALFDEIVVLGWSGKYNDAIVLYEKNAGLDWPEYVTLSVAGSYYREGIFDKAAGLYQKSAQSSPQAKRWQAESLMRFGDKAGAEKLYDELLSANPKDTATYLSRGNLRCLTGDTMAGLQDLDMALSMAGEVSQQNDIRAQLAAFAIRSGDYNRGINYLKPAIASNSASLFMQADYILALRLNGDFVNAVQEGHRLWSDYKAVPSYGLQALADACLRSKQYKQAIEVYNSLLTRRPDEINRKDVLGGLAFAAMKDGQVLKSKAVYTSLLREYPGYAPTVVGDIAALLEKGQYSAAEELGGVIDSVFPENVLYRQEVASLLARQGLNRDAAKEYQKVSSLGSQPGVNAGLAVTSIAAGDYKLAREGVNGLSGQSMKKPMIAEAIRKFAERPLGNVVTGATLSKDYKGNDNKDINISGQQQIGDRVAFSISLDRKRLSDNLATVNYQGITPGFIYRDLWQTAEFSWNKYNGDVNLGGYHAGYTRYFGDTSSLLLQLNKAPVDQAAAAKTGILETNQRLEYDKSIGKKDSYTAGMTRSAYSDGNEAFGYDGQFTHIYSDKNEIERNWQVYFSRNSFKQQQINGTDTLYESPSLREVYGAAWQQRWNFTRGYFENTLHMEWNRDHGENLSFSPYDRVAYNYRLGLNQWLSIGMEYGLHTISTGGGLRFGYRQFDISSQFVW